MLASTLSPIPAPADVVPAPPSDVEALRAESHAALARLVALLRYPPEWADELERRAFAAGRVWSSTASDDSAA